MLLYGEVICGGGICIDNSTNVTIDAQGGASDRIVIQNNSGGNYGGGVGIYDSDNITLTKLNILNNQAVGLNGLGGGTYYHSSTNVIFMSRFFLHSSANSTPIKPPPIITTSL